MAANDVYTSPELSGAQHAFSYGYAIVAVGYSIILLAGTASSTFKVRTHCYFKV